MNDSQRADELLDLLDLLYQKLGMFDRELVISNSAPAKFELNQRIKREILPSIRAYEAEYWSLYPVEEIVVPEQDAERHLQQIENAVAEIEQASVSRYPAGLVPLLEDVHTKLSENKPPSAKLKVAIPLIPAIATYEFELETGNAMQQAWNSLKNWIRK